MDKLKKALSGDDDDEESGIVTQVKRKSYLWMLSFINFAEIEMIVNDVSCGLKIEQSTCTVFINLMNIIWYFANWCCYENPQILLCGWGSINSRSIYNKDKFSSMCHDYRALIAVI